MNNNQSPVEQFLSKLTELERTMTKGPWKTNQGSVSYADTGDHLPYWNIEGVRDRNPKVATLDYCADEGDECTANMNGIAHLKNSNPTVIAMLKAVVELRAALLIDSSISQTTTRRLLEFDAHLNTLATEALGTKGEK